MKKTNNSVLSQYRGGVNGNIHHIDYSFSFYG